MRYRDLTGIDYDCEDCIHNDKEWDELPCDTCCHAHSGYEPREDGEAEEPKKCDTCKHEKEPWFNSCADCSDYELWESKE